MGIVLLLAVGGVLGWVCSIVLTETNQRAILTDIFAGAAGATALGLAMTSGPLLTGLSPTTLFYGIAGALAAVTLANMIRKTSINR